MYRILLCSLFCINNLYVFASDSLLLSNPGPFLVNSLTESTGIRNGPNYNGSTIFFPENTSGLLSSIVLVPGFMNNELTIQNWGTFLASHGIITMTIGTNSLTDSEYERRDALLDAIISLKEENTRFTSPLFLKLDTNKIAVGGFSKGGGGAQLAAKQLSEIEAVVALYPWIENPDYDELNHQAPVIIISGQIDLIAPPLLHADIHYDYTPDSTPKLIFEVFGASHDAISGPYAGAQEVGKKVLSWLKTFLVKDTSYCLYLLENPCVSSKYNTNLSCDNLTSTKNINHPKITSKVFDIMGRKTSIEKNKMLFIEEKGLMKKYLIID